ncbi:MULTISPECIES: hypothetical protein [Microcystis]|uniref:hypothetical protein n=1 Tax=Microcystis TaxID=1125 RepID=UPI001F5529C2|nr:MULTISPECIES: hypothetical protein [Microcystis]UZO78062.1 hypothetical protein M8120_09365 [Microcystis aeruginosa str. Chao 1910]
MGFRQESNSSGLVEPEILSSDARRIHVRLRRGVCQNHRQEQATTPDSKNYFSVSLAVGQLIP